MAQCKICNKTDENIAQALEVCGHCILDKPEKALPLARRAHAKSRIIFDLPVDIPHDPSGASCKQCTNECQIPRTHVGYCGIQENHFGHLRGIETMEAKFSKSLEPIPGNCTASRFCPGGSDCGYPKYSHSEGPEIGFKTLSVFYHACSFNCLFCKSWLFRYETRKRLFYTKKELIKKVKDKTSCISFHGGDPAVQIEFSIKTAQKARKKKGDGILRICWETNGTTAEQYLNEMVNLSMESGGIIKFDLKAFDDNLHIALTGVSNKASLENFQLIGQRFDERPEIPILVASTLMVPGYIEEGEVKKIAGFIASVNPNIPYTLLNFFPDHDMTDLPPTSKELADKCLQAAKDAGLNRVFVNKNQN